MIEDVIIDIDSFTSVYEITLQSIPNQEFNTTINNEEDVNNNYDLVVLGNIPDFSSARSDKKSKYYSNCNLFSCFFFFLSSRQRSRILR